MEIAEDLIGRNPVAAEQLKNNGSADLSYALAGRRAVPRQRLQAALDLRDRHARDPDADPVVPGSRPAGALATSCRSATASCSSRADRIGQVLDARRDRRPHERRARDSHPHDRGSDRVPARAQEGDDSSARAAQRHADVRPGAARGPAPGAEGHSGRRDARPRDDRDRARSVRNRPPRHVDAAHDRRRQDRRAHRRRVPAGRSARRSATGCRRRFSTSFRSACCRARTGRGRVAVLEILKSTLRTRDYVEQGESNGKTLLDAMRDGKQDGMQHFDGEIERLIRAET